MKKKAAKKPSAAPAEKIDLRTIRPKRRTERICLAVSPEEKRRMAELAQAEQLSITELIVRRVLGDAL